MANLDLIVNIGLKLCDIAHMIKNMIIRLRCPGVSERHSGFRAISRHRSDIYLHIYSKDMLILKSYMTLNRRRPHVRAMS